MREYLNGWTRELVEAKVRAEFKGKSICGGVCLYRSAGLKCVVGLFIPDNMYREETMEQLGAKDLFAKHPELTSVMPFDVTTMKFWQIEHDNLDTHTDLSDQIDTLLRFLDKRSGYELQHLMMGNYETPIYVAGN